MAKKSIEELLRSKLELICEFTKTTPIIIKDKTIRRLTKKINKNLILSWILK